MTSERKIELLTNIVKEQLVHNSRIMDRSDFNRELGNAAKKIGATTEEVREIVVPIIRSAIADMLAK